MTSILRFLGFEPGKNSVKVEVMAGITTFLTMSYILAVNPSILGETGMDKGAVFSATVVAAAIATLVMAFYAKLPFALASGMGINAFFAFTLVIGMHYTWQQALAAVFVEGIVFVLLTVFKVRESIVNAIPKNLRYAISVGIGLFIAFIGLKNGGIIVDNPATLIGLGPWTKVSTLAIAGVVIGAVLLALHVRGALFYTIIVMTVVGIPLGVTEVTEGFTLVSLPHSFSDIAFHMDFSKFLTLDINYLIVVFVLVFMDLFDTLGTLIGASTSAGMVDANGKIHNMNKALMSDAIGTVAGALCGTSTVTTYVESTTGIAAGGRTGLTSFTVAMLFLLALFFSPLFLIIPAAATTCALVLVGVMMIKQIVHIDFSDFTEAVPCFLTIVMMPFAYSISEGIVMGMLSYVLIKLLSGKGRQVSVAMYVLGFFFLLKYLIPLFQ
jgi:AGZA family xanthine/uracil permease-like MFS transporter